MAKRSPLEIQEVFRCPKCGGNAFGTVCKTSPDGQLLDWKDAEGHCNTIGCRFSWPRADDWKHMVFVYIAKTKTEWKRRWKEYDRVSLNPRDNKGRICRV